MAVFSELIKRFDKIRDYMRDFYIYGFKSRGDFTKKSARTYDNERRRIESYLGEYMRWDYSRGSKTAFISVDCARIPVNPLYAAWKSKSFTTNDIMLHFYILDVLRRDTLTMHELTDRISEQSERVFDVQTVRNKCKEYAAQGLIRIEKQGKAFVYSLCPQGISMTPELLNAIRFFQGVAPFGEVGSYLLDKESASNEIFSYKHHYIAHTLENGVLFDLLYAIRNHKSVLVESQSERSGAVSVVHAVPLKIFVSVETGRRFVCMYSLKRRRFANYRLDYIKVVLPDGTISFADELKENLEKNLDKVWGVGFGGSSNTSRLEILCMKLSIHEANEQYIIERLKREGHGGEIIRVEENVFLYTKEMFDTTDMSPWIKTFIGRIIGIEGTNENVINRFYRDVERMAVMYGIETNEEGDDK